MDKNEIRAIILMVIVSIVSLLFFMGVLWVMLKFGAGYSSESMFDTFSKTCYIIPERY